MNIISPLRTWFNPPIQTLPPRLAAPVRELQVQSKSSTVHTLNASEEILRAHVDNLVKYLRNPEHIGELNDSADYIKSVWENLGLKVKDEPFVLDNNDFGISKLGVQEFRNLSVSFGPQGGKRFVIGAHYDVFGNQPGADDNASGVAGLLELTRLMIDNNIKPDFPIDCIAYTLEENPYSLLGSRVHARSLKKAGIKVKGMIALEMIGYYSSEPDSQKLPPRFAPVMKLVYPTTGDFIAVCGFGNSLRLVHKASVNLDQDGNIPSHMLWVPLPLFGMHRSDHTSYSMRGYPACMVTDTSFMRNDNYHKPTDTPDTLDFAKMAQVVDGVFGLIKGLK